MIPKVIHYCWFGRKPLPPLAVKCIESWKKYFPDYEIKKWNEDNFNVNIIPYTAEAYAVKKYAFVSDYARFWILYHYGGLYFDTDVEVIRPMDDIIAKGPFMGCENDALLESSLLNIFDYRPNVNPGLGFGGFAGLWLYNELIQMYSTLHFFRDDGTLNMKTVVQYATEVLYAHGLQKINGIQCVEGIWIYPKEYFNPMDYGIGKVVISDKTYSIHHFAESWLPWHWKLKAQIKKLKRQMFG